MAIALTLEVLPARLGDCLLVECHRDGARPWRALIDGGPPDTWPMLQARLERLPEDDRRLDLVVVTHIDSDHIGGMLPFVKSPPVSIGDVWFNGREQLPEAAEGPRPRSVAQAESLVSALTGDASHVELPWNGAFEGGAATSGEDGEFREVEMPEGGPKLTLLSPTVTRLGVLRDRWDEELARMRRRELVEERAVLPPPEPLGDLAELAGTRTSTDTTAPNGSSIAFLLEHRGVRCLLGADAFPDVLADSLAGLARARGADSVLIDLLKLPHHGSKANVTGQLVAVVPARHYVVSSNGDTFGHPDDVAIARVVIGAPRRPAPTLWFNYRNPRTERWGEAGIRKRYGYRAEYPEEGADGIRIELEE
jgi:hypothetical protein